MAKPVLSFLTLFSIDPNPLVEALVCLGGTADTKKCGRGPTVHTVHFETLCIEISHASDVVRVLNPPVLTFSVNGEEAAGAAIRELYNSGINFKKIDGSPNDVWEIRMPEATLRLERQEDALIDALKQETGVTTG